jgi:hypothetical protein
MNINYRQIFPTIITGWFALFRKKHKDNERLCKIIYQFKIKPENKEHLITGMPWVQHVSVLQYG